MFCYIFIYRGVFDDDKFVINLFINSLVLCVLKNFIFWRRRELKSFIFI